MWFIRTYSAVIWLSPQCRNICGQVVVIWLFKIFVLLNPKIH